MKRAVMLLLLSALAAGSPQAGAREVILETGEVYREKDLTIRCTETAEPQLMTLADCQFWDGFDQVCRHERLTHHYGPLTCVEECQHWDSFDNTCHFATRCELLPAQRAFVRTTCDIFDDAENVCRRTRQDLLR